jgi:Ca2+-binding EF-hand superfamily protein
MKRSGAIVAFALVAFAAGIAGAQQAAPYDVKAAFVEADLNGDGSIELDEFYERLVDVFFLGDTNKDGFLTEEEFVKVVVLKEDFAKIDKNKEGRVDRREFVAARLPLFLVIDTDDDGELSITEVTAAYEGKVPK